MKPSLERRAALRDAGDELPKDVLSILLANEDALHLPHDVIVREVAFYLLAGAHTSATAFTRVSHNVLTWLEDHPEDADLVRTDRLFLQRCTHETVRLQPSSPVAMRWALADIELKSGRRIPEGAFANESWRPMGERVGWVAAPNQTGVSSWPFLVRFRR